MYKGYWKRGKQHGLGRYIVKELVKDNKQIVNTRYGLWKDGKLVQWFTFKSLQEATENLPKIEENLNDNS